MEDSDMPRLFRDAQVLSIWEGTTNVLSMDVWRPLAAPNALVHLGEFMDTKLRNAPAPLAQTVENIRSSFASLKRFAENAAGDQGVLEASARRFAYSLSRVYMAALLVEHATWSANDVDVHVANRWVAKSSGIGLGPLAMGAPASGDAEWRRIDRILALDLDANGNARGAGNTTAQGKIRARY